MKIEGPTPTSHAPRAEEPEPIAEPASPVAKELWLVALGEEVRARGLALTARTGISEAHHRAAKHIIDNMKA